MLLALVSGFALSQAFRTVTSIIATGLQAEFALSPQQLGTFASLFAFAFGIMQLVMGIALDVFGLRRTVLVAFPFTVAGALLSAWSKDWSLVLWGQALIGLGCAPAFLVCTVFIARYFAPHRFAAVSGVALGMGGLGMVFTGTPLAWVVEHSSWRMGFVVLAAMAVAAWLLIWRCVHEPAEARAAHPPEPLGQAIRGFGALFLLPHTWGILLLALVTYASLLTLRGLWLGPLLIDRHGFSLVESGNVALLVSLVALFSPGLFGRLDPGVHKRRDWMVWGTLIVAAVFFCMAFATNAWLDVGCALAVSFFSGYGVLQYADVRSAYPAAMTGRAMAVFTMALFLGAALMQWVSGLAASLAKANGGNPYAMVMLTIAGMLVAGALALKFLPQPDFSSQNGS